MDPLVWVQRAGEKDLVYSFEFCPKLHTITLVPRSTDDAHDAVSPRVPSAPPLDPEPKCALPLVLLSRIIVKKSRNSKMVVLEAVQKGNEQKGQTEVKRGKSRLGKGGKPARSLLACVWREEVDSGKCRGVVRKSKTGQREPGKRCDKAESGGDDTQPRRRWGSEYG
ncbi:hypothetical protein PpBr36_04975 [Pyricularia pennisetigena]|uniref:hypothetical protein n=1 Tax=Pyricularia pennisetigena TaxID=1578925 RepID=UPI00114FE248|nr:hypothetical protein PpBr36_04975 [Pyricularia pennisetigena]TLS26311.1 hypothetical protein PpBr36_04975 [Pyricularia pennisetigena]